VADRLINQTFPSFRLAKSSLLRDPPAVLLRLTSILIVVFWAVMTTQLVRGLWFQSGTQLASISTEEVLQLFLDQEDASSNLQIFDGDTKIGDATLVRRDIGEPRGIREIGLQGGAIIALKMLPTAEEIGFKSRLRYRNSSDITGSAIEVRVPALQLDLKAWSGELIESGPSDDPEETAFELRHSGTIVASSSESDGGLPPSLMWLGPIFETELARRRGQADAELQTRIDYMELAGRRREVYVVEPVIEGNAKPPFQLVLLPGGELVEARVGNFRFSSLIMTLER